MVRRWDNWYIGAIEEWDFNTGHGLHTEIHTENDFNGVLGGIEVVMSKRDCLCLSSSAKLS